MDLHHFEVDLDAVGYGHVRMDGQELQGVQAISIEARVGEPTRVMITMIARVDARAYTLEENA